MDKKNLQRLLRESSDEKYRTFCEKMIPSSRKFLGVRTPVLRKISKLVCADAGFAQNYKCDYFEEYILKASTIASASMGFDERMELVSKFVSETDSWAECDTLCAALEFEEPERKKVWNFSAKFRNSAREFESRFGYVMLLFHFTNERFLIRSLSALSKLPCKKYYAQMGAAWAIAEFYAKFPLETVELLRKNSLDKFTHNKAVQKIRESFRISEADKELVKTLKK